MTFYLAYGSNLNLNQMKFRCPKAKLLFNKYDNIVKDKNSFLTIDL